MRMDATSLLREPIGAQSRVELNLGFQRLSEDLSANSVRGALDLLRTDEGILARGILSVEVDLDCGRCLEPVQTRLDVELDERFVFSVRASERDQVWLIEPDHHIDLRPVVRDLVVVSTPMHILCRDDCKGLCPICGQNLNEGSCACETDEIDPRLSALKALIE